ncbi:hypothetical protein [Rhodopila globiformis]|uniref:hypothetical protein n=1 Tax=Rhodopila globiformis TaxID=1071 RepID=UPI0011AFEC5D|nr:hypothetical protein [Rhodopila globiformis]
MQIIHAGGAAALVALMAAHRAIAERPAADDEATDTPPDRSRRQDRVRPILPGRRDAPTAPRRSCS